MWLVLLTQPLDPDSGSGRNTRHFALLKAVAAKVSVMKKKLFWGFILKICQWQILATGIVSSPNYPENYPDSIEKSETIQVEKGLILSLEFTAFEIQSACSNCIFDHLTIMDGDGTILMDKSCICRGTSQLNIGGRGGQLINSTLPPTVKSKSNTVKILFSTDNIYSMSGWSINWRAVTPGECVFKVVKLIYWPSLSI